MNTPGHVIVRSICAIRRLLKHVGNELGRLVELRSRVEDLDVGNLSRFVKSRNLKPLAIRAGIALARHNDANGGSRIPLQRRKLAELLIDDGVHYVEQIALESHHERLTLGIAESRVIFKHARAGRRHH